MLPIELFEKILFNIVDIEDIKRIRLVCHLFNEILLNTKKIINIDYNQDKDFIKLFKSFKLP